VDGELARAGQQRVDPIPELGVGRASVEQRRDLDPDFARVRRDVLIHLVLLLRPGGSS
jgi:hypothetical protein